jgi:ABC-type transport system involved in multi-copper enzyme maturation permease subunit
MMFIADLSAAWRIAWFTLRRKRVSLAAFAVGAAAFHALLAVSFPAIGGMEAVQSVVRTFPPGLRALLKIAPNLQAGFGVQDYMAFSWMHPVLLGLGAAFVVGRATDALAGGIESGAAYLILSRPVRRWALVLGKFSEMFLGVGVIALTGWAGQVVGAWLTFPQPLPWGRFLMVALIAWLIFASLGSGALVISSLASRAAIAAGVGSAWTLIAFVLDVIPSVANSPVGWLNPWRHYFPQEIIASGRSDPLGVAILLGWIVGGVLCAMLIFERRDLV